VFVHFTQPAVFDTDGDGLDDGTEILILDFDALDPDMDLDGALDGDEILTLGTDPYDRDTDRDGLTDGDEGFVFLTDADDADSDGGGDRDGAEVGGGVRDPFDPGDDLACVWSNRDRYGSPTAPPTPNIEPIYVRIHWEGVTAGGEFQDYMRGASPYSAKIQFNFLDAGKNPMCSIDYDLSTTQSSPTTWATDSGARLWAEYDLDLDDGFNVGCNAVDPLVHAGFSDLRDLIEAIPWGIGYGEFEEHVVELQADAAANGWDYAVDYEPYVVGTYITMDQVTATEIGWVKGYEAVCSNVTVSPGTVVLPAVSQPAMPDALYEGGVDDPTVQNNGNMKLFTVVDLIDAVP
jgi:hypothetical protein